MIETINDKLAICGKVDTLTANQISHDQFVRERLDRQRGAAKSARWF